MIAQDTAVRLFAQIAGCVRRRVVLPAGKDDCGAVDIGNGLALVVTTDYTNIHTHAAALGVGSLRDRARFLVQHNVSDLLSSGVAPLAFVAAIGIPRTFGLREVRQLAAGLKLGSALSEVSLIGGDTKESGQLSLCGAAFGVAATRSLWRRDGARVGDRVFVTGPIGGSSAAVVLAASKGWRRDRLARMAIDAILHPSLPLALTSKLRRGKMRVAAIDISDGLGADLLRLCEQSGVAVRIQGSRIPLSKLALALASGLSVDPLEFAFGLGGDLQIAFCASRRWANKIRSCGAVEIGEVVPGDHSYLVLGRHEQALPTFGHSDFKKTSSREELRRLLGTRFGGKGDHSRPRRSSRGASTM